MDNILKMNLGALKEVSAMISEETGRSLIICDHEGEIIEATDKERIGKKHMGSIIIISGKTDEAIIDEKQAEVFRTLGTDTLAGYSYVITVHGKRAGSLGLAGDPETLKPIVRTSAKTIGIYISEYHKEKEKNFVLQKMADIADDIAKQDYESIDFHVFAEDIRLITGARFVTVDLHDQARGISTLAAMSAEENDLEQFNNLIGSQFLGRELIRSDIYVKKLQNKKSIPFNSFVYFSQEFIPLNVSRKMEKQFELGEVIVLDIAHKNKVIGNFSLLMPRDANINNSVLAELYAAQAGQLLVRAKAETSAAKCKSEFDKTWGLMDSFWEHSPNPICVLDTNGRVLRISRSGAEKMGLTPKMIEGFTLDKLFLPSYYELFMERLKDICVSREPHFYSDIVNFDGNEGLLEYSLFPINNKEDNSFLIGMVAYDMARSRQTEEQLEFISFHDTITGLNNRLYFEKEIKNLQDCHGFPLTVLSLDVDGLKIVNETLGHDRGNQLLRDLSRILKNSLRGTDLLARTGGDEFTIILYHTDQKGAEAVINRIESKIAEHNRLSADIMLNVSHGQATAYSAEENINDVLKRAEEHLYHNKLFQKKSSRSQIISSLMAALAERDYITQGHATRLLDLSVKLGTRKVLDPRTLTALALLSQVHDVGKVGIPDKILFKPGKLDDEEWEIMRMHPEKGYRIAIVSPDLKDIADLILKHHERWDGSGYPLGLKGEDIPLECRILSVIDSFDAMTSERPYNKPRSKDEAVQEIRRCAGTQFDPDIVNLFVEVIEEGKVS